MTYNPKRDWCSIIHACLKSSSQCVSRVSDLQYQASEKIHNNVVGLGNDARLHAPQSYLLRTRYFKHAPDLLVSGSCSNYSMLGFQFQ